jgi:hypothetical protein
MQTLYMPHLFVVLIGCKPPGRHIEQHDIFFGVADKLSELVPQLQQHWPETQGKMHIDGWRKVNNVSGYKVSLVPRSEKPSSLRLFFINLGGYKPGEFDEFHYKIIIAANDKAEAIRQAKASAFYKHYDFPGASSHIDDKYGVDVDDIYDIEDILPASSKEMYSILVKPSADHLPEDDLHLGYFKLNNLP